MSVPSLGWPDLLALGLEVDVLLADVDDLVVVLVVVAIVVFFEVVVVVELEEVPSTVPPWASVFVMGGTASMVLALSW